MSDTSAAQERVLSILAQVTKTPIDRLTPELELARDLDVGSATALELLATIEDELQVEISEVEAARLRTVGDVLELARKRAG